MSILNPQASEVRFREIDQSQTLVSESSSTAALVFVSAQGPSSWTLYTDSGNFLNDYGNPNAQISFGHYSALDYFREGNVLWARRVVNTDALYSAALVRDNAGVTELGGVSGGLSNPAAPPWSSNPYTPSGQTPMFVVYPKNGQGSFGNNLAVRVSSNNLARPAAPSSAQTGTGGTLTAATYTYMLSALSRINGALVETQASVAASVVVGSGTTNKITLTWPAIPGAVGYNIYGRTGGTPTLLKQLGGGTLTYVDTGTDTAGAQAQITTTVAPTDRTFVLDVFDTTFSSSTPVESFTCTLSDNVDDTGAQTEIVQRVNPFSQYIRVTSNASSLVSIPYLVGQSSVVNLTGGASGTAPTSSMIEAAWEELKNTELYNVDLLINAGYDVVSTRQKIEEVARTRGTAVALLDVSSLAQGSVQSMIDWRNLTQNMNSSYAAFFGPDYLEDDRINGRAIYIPPSGMIAGLCARTDREAGPWYSIAGLNRGILSILGTRLSIPDDASRTLLFKAQINYARTFVGQGIALMESMTTQAKFSALSWLSVRRLVNLLKKSTYKFLLYSLHEPNDDFLRRKIVSDISEYLQVVQDARGISKYAVIANETNNPPALYNAGQLKVTVIITPVIPTHEILVDMVITKQGVDFTEINIRALG
jgi:hypothetical protein